MADRRKSWREKLEDDKGLPQIHAIDRSKSKRWGQGTFVIPAPREVDALMGKVPKGKVTTIEDLRKVLARRHHATVACPMTTGIFAWIAAHAAAEVESGGGKRVTPYWRTLKSKGELNPKYPGGVAALKKHLAEEGHRFMSKGKRWFVKDFQERLARLSP